MSWKKWTRKKEKLVFVSDSESLRAELSNRSSTSCKRWADSSITLSACIGYKTTERLRGGQQCWTAIPVITKPSTTSDIDHLIPTELIINMTGSCSKEKRSCALFKAEAHTVHQEPWTLTGGITLFYQRCPSLPKMNIFCSRLSNDP